MIQNLQPLTAHDAALDDSLHAGLAFDVLSITRIERRNGYIVTPGFKATIRNPGIGGLSAYPGQYFVWSDRETLSDPLSEVSRARLTGLPTELAAETCDLEFWCLPPDDDDVIKSAADALRVTEVDYDPDADEADREAAERYEPLCFGPDASDDPTNVLLARRHLWRWHHKHPLGVSLVPLDVGVTEHLVNVAISKTVRLRVTNPPKNISKLRLVATWTQTAKGKQSMNRTGEFSSYTFEDFMSQLPKSGDPIGNDSGWTFDSFSATMVPSVLTHELDADSEEYGEAAGGTVTIRPNVISYDYRAAYDYQQSREEYLDISMPAAKQNVLGDLKVEAVETISLGQLNLDLVTPDWRAEDPETLDVQHYDVGDRVQKNGHCYVALVDHDAQDPFRLYDATNPAIQLWQITPKKAAISDISTARYFGAGRAKRSERYGIRRLDRVVCERSLAAEVSFEMPAAQARDITCADSIRLEYARLSGGECVGVVSSIEYACEGSRRVARVTILCGIGDGSAAPTPGEDQEIVAGVVYTTNYGAVSTPVNAGLLPSVAPFAEVVYRQADEQLSAATTAAFGGLDPIAAINSLPTYMQIGFPSLPEQDLIRRRSTISCVPINVPKGIDISPEV